jgi:hypothetical protein
MSRSRSADEETHMERVAPDEEYMVTGKRKVTQEHYSIRTPRRVHAGIAAYPASTPTPEPRYAWEKLFRDRNLQEAFRSFEAALQVASRETVLGSFQQTPSVHELRDVDMASSSQDRVWLGQVKALEMLDLPNLIDLTGLLTNIPRPEGIELLYEGHQVADPEFWKVALPRDVQARIINGVTELVEWLTQLEQLRNALMHGLPSASSAKLAPEMAPAIPDAVATSAPTSAASPEDVLGEADAQTKEPLEDVLREEHPQLLAMYREANTLELRDLTIQLRELFATKELAYMADTSTRTVRNWIEGSVEQARPESASRLRTVFTCVLILRQEEGPLVIKNWFTNTNPYLDFHAPAQVIRDGKLREAIKAARVYAEYAGA